jgi:autotransporter translocation and assembly factor TamB
MLQKRVPRVTKYLRRTLRVIALVATIVVAIIVLALVTSQTPWFKNWLRKFIVREANQYVNGTLSIGSLGGDLFYGIQLGDVSIEVNGERVVALKRLEVKYSIAELVSSGITVRQIRLEQPFILLRRDESGWNVASLVKREQQEANRQGPGKPMTMPDIEIVDGHVQIDDRAPSGAYTLPKQIAALNAKAAYAYEPVHYSVTLSQFSFAAADPTLTVKNLTGRLGTRNDDLNVEKLTLQTADSTATVDGIVAHYLGDPDLQVTFSAPRLSLPECAGVLPSMQGYALHPAIDLKAQGKQSALQLMVNGKSEAGALSGRIMADVLAPDYAARGDLTVQDLNLAPLLKDTSQKSDITAHATLDLKMATAPASAPALDRLRGHVSIDAPKVIASGYRAGDVKLAANVNGRRIALDGRAAAYGATATARGTIVAPAATGQPVQFDLTGAVSHVNLSQLPATLNAPRVGSNLNVQSYHVKGQTGSTTTVDASAVLGASTVPGAAIADGTTAQMSMISTRRGGIQSLTYGARGAVSDVNLATVGHAFSVAALDKPDYDSRINAQFDITGSGVRTDRMKVDANGTVTNTQIYGGMIPQLAFEAHLANNGVQGRANGSFQGFDPSKIAGNPRYAGQVNGTVDAAFSVANLSAPITPEAFTADGKVTLAQTDVAGFRMDTADVEGQYANRRGNLRQATVKGPAVDLTASGPIALDENGQSNITLHASMTDLAGVGKIVDQPISGMATVDAKITGNANSLQAAGTLKASNIAYQQNKALAVTSQFDATIPNLDAAHARLHAQTTGTFIDVGGFHINTLTADTTYADQTLGFQAHVAQAPSGADAQVAADEKQKNNGVRELDATGSVIFHPDHQEIHLPSLALRTQGVQWQTPPGSNAAIQYGSDRVQLQDVRLVNGNQSLATSGAFSLGDTPSAEGVSVHAQNVDIAQVEQLAMQSRGFTGTLNADATISGDVKAPDVTGHVEIQNGGFRQFKYQSFTADGGYRNETATIDARLVQQPGVELTAKGTAPLSALKPNPPGVTGHIAPSGADQINVRIQSSSIGLGIVEGFTDQVTNATGTVQADVTVTGSGEDPHLNGYVAINNAAFAVPQAGTHYSGLTTRIELDPDHVHIPRLQIADSNGSPMTIEGDLAVHASTVGAVNVTVQSRAFKLMDNELGKIAVDTDLRLSGDLRHPRVEGNINVPAGRLELDRVLLMMSNPYSTEALAPVVSAADVAKSDKGAEQATRAAFAQGRAIGTPQQNAPAPTTGSATGAMAPLAMNIHFRAPDDFVVRGNDLRPGPTAAKIGNANVTVGADLTIQKQPDAQMTIRGTANTVRGFYEFQGRRFTVRRDGTLRFDGLPEINPTIDVSADRLIPNTGVTATVRVTGTASAPKLALSSDPPLDESDILSLIVFNQNVNDLGTGQRASLAETAAGIASGFVAQSLGSAVGKALDVDLFQITTSDPDTGETAGGVTLGKQLNDRVFVQFRQQFGDRSFTEFMMEYQLAKFLRADVQGSPETTAVANRLTERRVERAGVDLIFFFSY